MRLFPLESSYLVLLPEHKPVWLRGCGWGSSWILHFFEIGVLKVSWGRPRFASKLGTAAATAGVAQTRAAVGLGGNSPGGDFLTFRFLDSFLISLKILTDSRCSDVLMRLSM